MGQARADDKNACIEADASGQELRLKSQWREAALRFKQCTRLVCPAPIVQDCVDRYDDLQAAMPTLIVAAKRPDGTDTVDARLLIDGIEVTRELPATAIEVDPGVHVVHLEHDGWASSAQTIVLREREKDGRIVFRFAETAPSPARSGPSNALGIALTAGGAVATGVGIAFVVAGLADRSVLLGEPCADTRTCSPDEVNIVQRDYVIGAIVAGAGLVALGVGVWELLSPARRARVGVGPAGAGVTF